MRPFILTDVSHWVKDVDFANGFMSAEEIKEKGCNSIAAAFIFGGEEVFKQNKQLRNNNVQLGWNVVAKFRKQGRGFVLERIEPDDYETVVCFDVMRRNTTIYNNVVTAAVDTCAFVMLESYDSMVMAHLDFGRLDKGLKKIKEFLPAHTAGVTGVCTCIEGEGSQVEERNQFARELRDAYGEGIELCVRQDNGTGSGVKYYGHFMIGVCRDGDGATQLIGDVTANPHSKNKTTRSYLFSNTDEFRNIVRAHFKAPEL